MICPIRSWGETDYGCEASCAWYAQAGTEPDAGHCLMISIAASLERISRAVEKMAGMDVFMARRRGR